MKNKFQKTEQSGTVHIIIKRFMYWFFKNIVIILTLTLMTANAIMSICAIYPMWIGYFNYLLPILPLFIKTEYINNSQHISIDFKFLIKKRKL